MRQPLSARGLLWAWVAAMLVLAALVVAVTRFGGSLTAFLPNSGSVVERALVRGLHKGQASRLLLLAIRGGTQDQRAHASRQLVRRLQAHHQVFALATNGGQDAARGFAQFLTRYRYLLAPRTTWSAAALRADLKRDLMILESPAALSSGAILADPTGALQAAGRPWIQSMGPKTRHGIWVSPRGHAALLLVETRQSGFSASAQRRALTIIHKAFMRVAAPALTLQIGGTGAITVAANAKVARSARILTVIDVMLVAAILFFVYRSLAPLLGSLVPLLTGGLAATAVSGLVFSELTVTTLGFGTMLIGVAMDYPTYVLLHARPGEHVGAAARRISRALGLAVIAMVIGFSTMLFSHLAGLVQLGVFASVGLLGASLAARFILPSLMPDWQPHADLSRWDGRAQAATAAMRRGRMAVPIAVLAALGVLYVKGGSVWNDHLHALSPAPRALMAETGRMASEFGVPGLSSLLVVIGPDREGALHASEGLVPTLRRLKKDHAIGSYDLAAAYLPSVAVQTRRQAALPRHAVLLANLRRAAAGLPFRMRAFAPFLAAVHEARHMAPLRPSTVPPVMRAKLSGLLMTIHGHGVAFIHLSGVQAPGVVARLVRDSGVPDAHYVVVKRAVSGLLAHYRTALLHDSILAGLLMALVIAMGLRSWREGVRLVVPMAGAIIVTAALLVLMGHGLTLLNVVALLLIAGLGMGYALFLGDHGLISERRPLAPWVCAATTVTGFGVMATAPVALLASVGLTVSIGALLALAFTAAWSHASRS